MRLGLRLRAIICDDLYFRNREEPRRVFQSACGHWSSFRIKKNACTQTHTRTPDFGIYKHSLKYKNIAVTVKYVRGIYFSRRKRLRAVYLYYARHDIEWSENSPITSNGKSVKSCRYISVAKIRPWYWNFSHAADTLILHIKILFFSDNRNR